MSDNDRFSSASCQSPNEEVIKQAEFVYTVNGETAGTRPARHRNKKTDCATAHIPPSQSTIGESSITDVPILFQPGKRFKKLINSTEFEKIQE